MKMLDQIVWTKTRILQSHHRISCRNILKKVCNVQNERRCSKKRFISSKITLNSVSETPENNFWREGRYNSNLDKWYSSSDCEREVSSVSNTKPLNNDLRIKWDQDLKMESENKNTQMYSVCERQLPSSVKNCPSICEYCKVDSQLREECVCGTGKYGDNCDKSKYSSISSSSVCCYEKVIWETGWLNSL